MSERGTDPRIELRRPRVLALIEDTRDLGLVSIGATLGEVLALSVTAAAGESPLGAALRAGAVRAVQVVEPAIAEVDYLAVAHVLACAVRHLCDTASGTPVIVLTGDRGRGAVGPAVAERLTLPHLGAVAKIETQGDRLTVERHSGARRQRYRGSAPVVLACLLPAASTDEVPGGGGGEIETLALDALQITLPELRYRRRFRPEVGAPIAPRAHVLASAEHLHERLQHDGIWAKAR